jgi:hypothetical protein
VARAIAQVPPVIESLTGLKMEDLLARLRTASPSLADKAAELGLATAPPPLDPPAPAAAVKEKLPKA